MGAAGATAETGVGPAQGTGRFRLVRRGAYWCFVLGIWGAIGLACSSAITAVQLPQMSTWAVPERPPNVRIVSVDGELVANRGDDRRQARRCGSTRCRPICPRP